MNNKCGADHVILPSYFAIPRPILIVNSSGLVETGNRDTEILGRYQFYLDI